MGMGRWTSAVLVTSLLVGWGSLVPPLTRAQEAGLVEPPPAFINGVAGVATSWCNESGCADSLLPEPDDLPLVSAPFALELPGGAQLTEVRSWDAGTRRPEGVAFSNSSIGAIPESAVMLSVTVGFDDGGDATYFWALEVATEPAQPVVPDTAMKAP